MTIHAGNEAAALDVSEEVVKSIEETEQQLSTWRPTSELSRLNAQPVGKPFPATASLCRLMRNLREEVEQSKGAFDPTVGRIVKAWGIHENLQVPTAASLREAVENTGFIYYSISSNCEIEKARDVMIDAGAFGKGEALDRVLALASAGDFPPFLLNFGGQIAVWKKPPNSVDWESVLADPVDREKPSVIHARFTEGSISTSGQSEQQKEVGGKQIGHIVDPRSGEPVPAFGSVTVWSKSALEADVLSTALFVMGLDEGMRWAESHHVAACFQTGEAVFLTSSAESIMKINSN